MRWILFLAVSADLAISAAPSLEDARVQLPYREFRELIDAAMKAAAPAPPVASAVVEAKYLLRPGESSFTGSAEFEVQTFADGTHAVPLFGNTLLIEGVEPKDATIVARNGFYALILDGRRRAKVAIAIRAPVREPESAPHVEWAVSPAVRTAVALEQIPEGRHAVVENGLRIESSESTAAWRLGGTDRLRVAMREKPKPLPPPITMPAVVAEAKSDLRVVSAGAFANKMEWRVRHQGSLVWKLNLRDDCRLVSSRVSGQAVSPSRVDSEIIEFRLPDPGPRGETIVELSYTGKGKPFEPVRGEIALELPATPLLVELIQWRIVIPAAYETVATEGNAELVAGSAPGEIRLTKELCQSESPAVRIFYQRPETRTKP